MVNDHYPILSLLNGYNWEYTQHFQTNPYYCICSFYHGKIVCPGGTFEDTSASIRRSTPELPWMFCGEAFLGLDMIGLYFRFFFKEPPVIISFIGGKKQF